MNGRDEISERIQATAPLVAAVLQGIHARSPRARVLFVNYAAILPDSGGMMGASDLLVAALSR